MCIYLYIYIYIYIYCLIACLLCVCLSPCCLSTSMIYLLLVWGRRQASLEVRLQRLTSAAACFDVALLRRRSKGLAVMFARFLASRWVTVRLHNLVQRSFFREALSESRWERKHLGRRAAVSRPHLWFKRAVGSGSTSRDQPNRQRWEERL